MKKFWLVFVCVCLLSLLSPQVPVVGSSGIPSVPLALADDVTVPLTLADEATLPPSPPGPVKPNPPPAFPPEPQLPTISHLLGQSRELELEIGARILKFCAAEKTIVMGRDGSCLVDLFSTVSEQKRIGDSFGAMRSEWLFWGGGSQKGDKGKLRLDQEIDDPIIVIKDKEALCYLRETIWIRSLDHPSDGSLDTAEGRSHSILLEKKMDSWVIRYDLFGSAYTTLPPEAPLVTVKGSYPSTFLLVSGFPSFEETLSSLPSKPQWYLKMMEKTKASSLLDPSPDRGAAVRYAEIWWNGHNTTDYPNYEPGDCANFVSQCLHEGGWLMDYEGALWWSTQADSFATWRLAGDHHDGQYDGLCWYLLANGWPDNTPRGTFLGTAADSLAVAQLEIGDVVCLEKGWEGSYYGHHVGICVGYDIDPYTGNYSPLISAHSTAAHRVSLSYFSYGYPASQLFLYRVSYPYETTPFELNSAGWHMVTPGVYSALPANQIFGPNLVACFGWDVTNQIYVDKKYSPLSAGQGYWLRVSAPTTAYLSGYFYISGFQINILSEWNMIGSPFERITAWTNVLVYNSAYGYSLNMPAAKDEGWIQSIFYWNGNNQTYEVPNLNLYIWPGYGYWIKPANSVTLTFYRP
ncbi:MAG: amidase domain-containing protein [Coprothermobacterota bacterium]|nr:amidase domain-containing protein [Coprothermobacterota bacterium]